MNIVKIIDETIFLGVYGALRPHPWLAAGELTQDAYSLFYARSCAMGWLADASAPSSASPAARWGMNDAGQDWSDAAGTSRVAWFQVALFGPPDGDKSLPIQPLLACAESTLNRVGSLRLDGLQLLLPIHSSGVASRQIQAGRNWFAMSAATLHPIRVTLDGGESSLVRDQLQEIAESVNDIVHGGELLSNTRWTSQATTHPLSPPVVDELWLGKEHHTATLYGTLSEWSFDSLGWTVSVLAEACRRSGAHTSVLVSVDGMAASTVPK
jgi:hypothetical protein